MWSGGFVDERDNWKPNKGSVIFFATETNRSRTTICIATEVSEREKFEIFIK